MSEREIYPKGWTHTDATYTPPPRHHRHQQNVNAPRIPVAHAPIQGKPKPKQGPDMWTDYAEKHAERKARGYRSQGETKSAGKLKRAMGVR